MNKLASGFTFNSCNSSFLISVSAIFIPVTGLFPLPWCKTMLSTFSVCILTEVPIGATEHSQEKVSTDGITITSKSPPTPSRQL